MTFDAYHLWLGIPPQEQPPDHYRLLGLQRFESHAHVISMAAERQTAHVRKFASGEHRDAAAALLNEIAAAKLVLLDPSRRAQYDQQLQPETAVPPPRPAPPPNPPVRRRPAARRPQPIAEPDSTPSRRPAPRPILLEGAGASPTKPGPLRSGEPTAANRRRRRGSPRAEWLKVILGGAAGLALGWWVIQAFVTPRSQPLAEAPAAPGPTAGPQPEQNPPATSPAPPQDPPPDPPPTPAATAPQAPPDASPPEPPSAAEPPADSAQPTEGDVNIAILRTAEPFRDLPPAVQLPLAGEASPIPLGRLGADANDVSWSWIRTLDQAAAGHPIEPSPDHPRVWLIRAAGQPRAVAAIRQASSGDLNLVYSPFAPVDPAEALAQTSLVLRLDDAAHAIKLGRESGAVGGLQLDLVEGEAEVEIPFELPEGSDLRLVMLGVESPTGVVATVSPSMDVAPGEKLTVAWNEDAVTELQLEATDSGASMKVRSFYQLDPGSNRRSLFAVEKFTAGVLILQNRLAKDEAELKAAAAAVRGVENNIQKLRGQLGRGTPAEQAVKQRQITELLGNHAKLAAKVNRLSRSIPDQYAVRKRYEAINDLGKKLQAEARLQVAVEAERDGRRVRLWQAGQ